MTQNKQMLYSEIKVLKALKEKTPQTWSELLTQTKLSSRTLQKTLKRLENAGKIHRKVEDIGKYPPPVFYGLTKEGQAYTHECLEPFLYMQYAFECLMGLPPSLEYIYFTEKEEQRTEKIKKKYADMPPKKRYEILAKKFFAVKMFSLINFLETENELWVDEGAFLLPTILSLAESEGEADLKKKAEQLRASLAEAFPREYEKLQRIHMKYMELLKIIS
jgi:DNA-binding PadR family transcriptional regulator